MWWEQMGELLLPRACAGCAHPGQVLCAQCRQHLREVPHLVARPRDIGAPVYALGSYSHIRRNVILAMKEQGNRAVREYIGAVVAAGIDHLAARGDIPHRAVVVPAPTRARSARARGGDPMAQICAYAAARVPGLQAVEALALADAAVDQSRLGAAQRWANMRGAVRVMPTAHGLVGRDVVVVDDVITTGATLAASIGKLRGSGAKVRAGLVLADA